MPAATDMKLKKILPLIIVLVLLPALVLWFKYGSAPKISDYSCPGCNVILISMTNLRYDHTSFDGYSLDTTPNLDKLAGGSLVFDNAFSHASWTLPESISIFTGLYPYEHGVMARRNGSTLSKDTPTLMDFLNKAGYKTAAFTGGFDYNPEFGATGRFSTYEECANGKSSSYPRQSGPRVGTNGKDLYGELKCSVPKAVNWLKKNSKDKFFLEVQGFDAHCPFNPGAKDYYDPNYNGKVDFTNCLWTYDKTDQIKVNGELFYPVSTTVNGLEKTVLLGKADIDHLVSLYDSSIKSADDSVGQIIDTVNTLGLSDNTIIIFTSEHGDMFGKYGRFMRGGPAKGTFYDDVLHIPLTIKLPNISGKRIGGLVGQIDLMPTILDLLKIQNTAKIDGKSLRPLMFNNIKVNDYVYGGSLYDPSAENDSVNSPSSVDYVRNLEWKLIRQTDWTRANGKLIEGKSVEELYNIKDDKEEMNNLAGSNSKMLKTMENLLDAWANKVKSK